MTRPEAERYYILSELESSPREDIVILRPPEIPDGIPANTFKSRVGWSSFEPAEKIVLRDLSHNLLYVPIQLEVPYRGTQITWRYNDYTRESALEYARTFARTRSSFRWLSPTGDILSKGEIDESSLIALITYSKGATVEFMLLYPIGL